MSSPASVPPRSDGPPVDLPAVPSGPRVTLALVLVTGLVLAVPLLAWLVSAETAVWTLAGGCVVLAAVRATTAAGGVLRTRTRLLDVALLLAAAGGLAALAPLASTMDIVGV